ncbi:MAG: hypothetical protein MUO82_02335 [Candidatus Thermoplasmatota archaeon]|nr:hypothetical protein [Candidatus Thermoplasmatota archaeon]
MLKKKRWLVIIIIITLLLSIFPNIASQSFNIKSDEIALSQSLNIQDTKKIQDVTLNIIINNTDGNHEKIFKKISRIELNKINSNLIKILNSDLDYIEKFEYVLEELKENNLISNNIKLEDIIDLNRLENKTLKFTNVTNKNFIAHFSPIIVVGGGIGLGLGYQGKRLTNAFSHFFALIFGGYVLCLDFLNSIKYQLISLLAPVLVGYIAGFTGIIIFAVFPGLFYSNLLMIGFAPFTSWLCFPEVEG